MPVPEQPTSTGAAGGRVVDAHLHVWDPARASYPWLAGAPAVIDRALGLDDVLPDLDAAGVSSAVLVQSADDLRDTDLMLEAARDARVAGVVAYAPLHDPATAEVVVARYVAEHPVVRGVRVLVHEQPDPWWLLRDDVLEGLGVLARHGLTFDVVAVRPEHLRAALRVSELLPELILVLDHLGTPPTDGPARDGWRDLLAALAANPRAHAKVSGLYPPGLADPDRLPDAVRRVRPAVDHALDVFGPRRCLYGGDWPVSRLHGGYGATWPLTTRLLEGLDATERDDVLGGTAVRVYGLGATTTATPTTATTTTEDR